MPTSDPRFGAFLPRWRIGIVLLLMIVSVNSAIFFGGRTLLPFTSSSGILPYPYGYTGPKADSLATIDPWGSMNAYYAFDAYTAQSLRQGILPFWNPYQGLGLPFLANGLSAVLYPPNWLHVILPPAWWDLVYLLNWLLAAVFLYLYLQLINVPDEAALIGGAAIFASGFFQSYLPLRDVPAVAAWWPLLLYGIERTTREPGWRFSHLVLAFATYCTITGGQPEVTFVSLAVAAVYGLARLVVHRQHAWRVLGAVVPGAVAGLFLAAPLWVNFAQYAFTAYSAHPTGSAMGQLHLGFTTAAMYIFPYLYGRLHTWPFGPISGWDWNLCPGWLPATALFLVLVSLTAVIKKPRSWQLGFLWAVAGLIGAKIWGLPGIGVLGKLPIFERIIFPRYAAFLLTFAFAGLAAAGAWNTARFTAHQWRLWLGIWFVLIVTLLALGLLPTWPAVLREPVESLPVYIVVVFGGLGLAWAVVGPIGLWWLSSRRSHEHRLLYFVTALGILLQGTAYIPSGFMLQTYAILSVVSLGLFVIVVLVIGLVQTIRLGPFLVMAGCLCVALPSLGAALLTPYGLAARYNPLTPAPFLNKLIMVQRTNLYRSYSLDFALQANFAAPFAITSLNSLEAIVLADSATFMLRYLDRGQSPLMFLAYGVPDVLTEFWHNHKRYFDLIGVKYLITQGTNPHPVLYDTETVGGKKDAAPLFKPLEMSIVCPTDSLSSIHVALVTYARKNPGTVTLSLYGDDGAPLRQRALDAASLLDNSFQEFQFPPLQGMKDQPLHLRLEFVPAQPDAMIGTWTYHDQPALGFAMHIIDHRPELTLLYEAPESQVRVWENHTAGPRAFLAPRGIVAASGQEALARLADIPDLARQVWIEQEPEMTTTWPETQSPGELLSFSLTPNTVSLRYEARTAGILTLADSYADGWRATLNGREVPVLRVDGVFRGIRIGEPGTYEVYFWYRPTGHRRWA